jgi:hypothetical protein
MARTGSVLVWVGVCILLYAAPAIAAQYSSFDDELTSMPDVLVRRQSSMERTHVYIYSAARLAFGITPYTQHYTRLALFHTRELAADCMCPRPRRLLAIPLRRDVIPPTPASLGPKQRPGALSRSL